MECMFLLVPVILHLIFLLPVILKFFFGLIVCYLLD